eukprot:gene3162-1466_t
MGISKEQKVIEKGNILDGRITTIPHILVLPNEELAAKAHITAEDVSKLREAICRKLNPQQPCSLLDIWKQTCHPSFLHTKLSAGCQIIDDTLKGGLLVPGINEISGESGSGKTQIALQLCLTVQLDVQYGGLQGGALFISTEDAFPTKRLHQLAHHMQKRLKSQNENLMDSIYIEHAADVESLKTLVNQRIPTLLMNSNVRLIVIDSIAAVFRVEYTVNENLERSKALAELGQRLHIISHKYRVAIVCINQISDVVSADKVGSEDIGGRRVIPALGLSWANAVTVRLMVMRTPYTVSQLRGAAANSGNAQQDLTKVSSSGGSIVRKLKVLFAPHIPKNECYYLVEEHGVRGF